MKGHSSKTTLALARAAGALALAVILGLILLHTVWGAVTPTNTWVDLDSLGSTYLGQPVPVGAQIAVFDPQGVQCGEFAVTRTGWYGIMPCYGDDLDTPEDEGAVVGDVLRFTINGATAETEAVSVNGNPISATTVVTWDQARSLWQVNLAARLAVSQHTLTSSANPANLGQEVMFTTIVTGSGPGGETPTGAVQFWADGSVLGTVGLGGGQAAISTADLVVGTHTISATYGGDQAFYPSTASLIQEVRLPLAVTALSLEQSPDKTAWTAVAGDLAGGYTMELDPAQAWYYLDVASLTANRTLADGYYGFTLGQTGLPAGWLAYWAAKGVVKGAPGWQGVMWQIINGTAPIFYLKVSSGSFMLVDGLGHALGQPDDFLRVNGDYPLGTYSYSGSVADTVGSSATVMAQMTFKSVPTAVSLTDFGATAGLPATELAAGLLAGLALVGAALCRRMSR